VFGEIGGVAGALKIRVPAGNCVPFWVNGLSLEKTFQFLPQRRPAEQTSAASEPHGTRYANMPLAS